MRLDRSLRGGGVMIFWRSDIIFHHIQIPTLNKLETIALKLKIGNKWLLVIGAYRPPNITPLFGMMIYLDYLISLHQRVMTSSYLVT